MDQRGFAEVEHGGKSKKTFGRLFGIDKQANGLLAVHRWQPVLPRHYADHADQKLGYVERHVLRKLVDRAQPLLRTVPLTHPNMSGGRPLSLYCITRRGYDLLFDLAEAYWPDVVAEEALGPFKHGPGHVRWRPTFDHDQVARDILLAAERDACNLDQVRILDQVAEFAPWGGKRAPTAVYTPLERRMKSDAANIMGQGGKSYVDEIEIELSHATLSSNDPGRVFETIEGKIKSYWSVLAAGMVMEKYQVTSPVFRVLFVTGNEAHALNIAKLANTCGLEAIETGKRPIQPNDIFLATTIERAKEQFFGEHWIKPDGSRVSLAQRRSL